MSTYAITDLHGSLKLFKQVQSFLKDDDVLYVLGDCGDRGEASWETIKEVAKDKRCIYLKGNHEDLLVKAIQDEGFESYSLLAYNGGADTFDQWIKEEQKDSWYFYLKKLPTYKQYINKDGIVIHLSHAGFTPYNGTIPCDNDLLWDRLHIFDKNIDIPDNHLVVHGHTPIPLIINDFVNFGLMDKFPEDAGQDAFWYCDNHKVCIDAGSYSTNLTIVLDLDTFDSHIFSI